MYKVKITSQTLREVPTHQIASCWQKVGIK